MAYNCFVSFQVKAAEVPGGLVGCLLECLPFDSFYMGIRTTKTREQLGMGFSDNVRLCLLLLLRSVFSKAKPSRRQGEESGDKRSEDETTSLQHHFGSPSVFLGQLFSIISCTLLCR